MQTRPERGKRKTPINRNNMFFSEEDFQFEMDTASEYMENDVNQTIVLYEVDMDRTSINDVYSEAKKSNIRFKTPVELVARYEIADSEEKSYSKVNQKGVYVKPGTLTVQILSKTLEENGCEIKRGDFIGVQVTSEKMLYFTVFDDGKIASYANSQSLYGTKPYFRLVKCNYVDPVDFNG